MKERNPNTPQLPLAFLSLSLSLGALEQGIHAGSSSLCSGCLYGLQLAELFSVMRLCRLVTVRPVPVRIHKVLPGFNAFCKADSLIVPDLELGGKAGRLGAEAVVSHTNPLPVLWNAELAACAWQPVLRHCGFVLFESFSVYISRKHVQCSS